MHPFIEEIRKQIEDYDNKKGGLRKLSQKFFGDAAYFGQSTYMKELKSTYEAIKDKETLTMKDLKWFYEDCYSPSGKHSNPQLYGKDVSLSGDVYQAIEKSINRYFPGSIDQYKNIRELANHKTSESMARYGDNVGFYKRAPIFDFKLNELLNQVKMPVLELKFYQPHQKL